MSTNDNLPVIPVRYTEERANKLIASVIAGKSMRAIADDLEVDITDLYDWLSNDKCMLMGQPLANVYVRARDIDADRLVDEIARLATKAEEMASDRESRPDGIRVAMQGLQWLASVRAPRRYNPKYMDAVTSGDTPSFSVNIQVNNGEVVTTTTKDKVE